MSSVLSLYALWLPVVKCIMSRVWFSPMQEGTKDYLLRGIRIELAEKVKVAATLHHMTMKDYLLQLLEAHVKELESKGLTLSLEKKRKK